MQDGAIKRDDGDDRDAKREKNEHAQALAALGASKGGIARAESMTPEERQAVAKKAALARWNLPNVTHPGTIHIGPIALPCANLDNGKRILTAPGLATAFGSSKKSPNKKAHEAALPPGSANLPGFLAYGSIYRHVSDELASALRSPLRIKTEAGNVAYAYDAEILPAVCEAILEAERTSDLREGTRVAAAARALYKGLARVGIVALVDEATGYQADRTRDALAKILAKFIAKELRPWVSTFPPDFYEQMFRLRGWAFDPSSLKRPLLVGNLTDNIVYKRLAPGVRDELRRMIPRRANGRLAATLHRGLTSDFGHPKLKEHLVGITALMKASTTWEGFRDLADRVYPKYGETLHLLPPDSQPNPSDDDDDVGTT